MKKIYLFGQPGCEGCQRLVAELSRRKVSFAYKNAKDARDATWMRTNGIFLAYYPALCVDGRLYEYADLFGESGEVLDFGGILK
jgi:hypothetical protein